MSDVSFVRTEMLSEREAPASTVGVIGWLRTNLFSGWINSILTIVALYFVYKLLAGVLPWIFYSSWSANSLGECREAIKATYGAHAEGACWAVIRDRYLQLTYGFYPGHLYWRVNVAFLGLCLAIAPVLFSALPRKVLWFTAIYPFLCFWLLWGGSVWVPIAALMGFVVAVVAYMVLVKSAGSLVATIAAFVTPVLWWLLLASPFASGLASVLPFGLESVESAKFGGFMLSVTIGVTGIALSLPIGIVLALGRQSDLWFLKTVCVGFIEFIRGVPLITLLFVASTLLNIFLPPGTNFDIIVRVIIMVTLFSAAYMAEVVRGGLAALPRGQYEAADSLGLDYWKAQRLIIMPQALKISIPAIVGNFIGLFKDTTLVSIIGLLDPIGLSTSIRANQEWNGILWELYGFIALVFFLFCFGMSRYSMYLERKLKTGH